MALAVGLEVADESVVWAVGALSAKVAMEAIQARMGVDRLSALVAIQARVGVERLRAWWPALVQSPHPSSSGSMLPGTMLATLLAVALLITLAWLGQKNTYTNLT